MENQQIKTKKSKILLILIGVILLIGILFILYVKDGQYHTTGKNYIKEVYNLKKQVINNYTDYINIVKNDSEAKTLLQNVVDENFFNTKSLIVLTDIATPVTKNIIYDHISKIGIKNNVAHITIYKHYGYGYGGYKRNYYIPVDNKQIKDIKIEYKWLDIPDIIEGFLKLSPFIILGTAIIDYRKTEKYLKKSTLAEDIKKKKYKKAQKTLIGWIVTTGIWGMMNIIERTSIDKPIIYLYPEKDKKVSVKLGYKDKITVSYPKYTTGWNVFAKTNGDLIDLDTNKNLYSLYYESKAEYNFKVEKEGFIVERDNITKFLEDKLSILGLTDREKEEFIIYWLPILQKNKYNYIRFAKIDEINANMPLEINPHPDTIIRILMTFKGLKKPIDIREQELETPERKGFVVVEWGGTELK